MFFQNESNYHYYFIIKVLANKSKGQFEYFDENTEDYKNLSIRMEKKLQKLIRVVMTVL